MLQLHLISFVEITQTILSSSTLTCLLHSHSAFSHFAVCPCVQYFFCTPSRWTIHISRVHADVHRSRWVNALGQSVSSSIFDIENFSTSRIICVLIFFLKQVRFMLQKVEQKACRFFSHCTSFNLEFR